MDPDAVDKVSETARSDGTVSRACRTADSSCLQHGSGDEQVLDFSAIVNSETPTGIGQVYGSALATAQSYPPDDYSGFRATAAEYAGCEATQVIPTAGRLAGLRLAMATTVTPGDDVLLPAPSCSEYAREVRLQGGEPVYRSHTAIVEANPEQFRLVCICQPNNPTGHAHDPATLRAFAERCVDAGTTVVLDETFLAFTEHDSLAGHPGLVTVQSLSALSGLPGLNAGFLVAADPHRERLDTARLTWELGVPAREVGGYCMKQTGFIEATRDRVRTERERLQTRLDSRFDVLDSDAPYVLFELPDDQTVSELQSQLRTSNIAVRDARTFQGLDNHVRVTVRSPDENDRLLAALDV